MEKKTDKAVLICLKNGRGEIKSNNLIEMCWLNHNVKSKTLQHICLPYHSSQGNKRRHVSDPLPR